MWDVRNSLKRQWWHMYKQQLWVIGMMVCTYKLCTRIGPHWLAPFFGPMMRHIFAFWQQSHLAHISHIKEIQCGFHSLFSRHACSGLKSLTRTCCCFPQRTPTLGTNPLTVVGALNSKLWNVANSDFLVFPWQYQSDKFQFRICF